MGFYVYYEYLNKIINFDDEYKIGGRKSIIWIYSVVVVVVVVGAINFRNYSRRGKYFKC